MYQSQIRINRIYNKDRLVALLKKFLQKHKKVSFGAMKRDASLAKLPDVIVKRKRESKRRLQCFFVAIDILKKSKVYEPVILDGQKCFEVRGLDKEGNSVFVHLREEKDARKNKVIYLVSTFWKEKK